MRVTSEIILSGPIAPVLKRMTVPMIYGIAAMFMFQTVDMYFISRLGTTELAALSFSLPITFILTSFTLGLTIALSIIVGKAIGAGRRNLAARLTTNAMIAAIAIVVPVSILGPYTIDPLFNMMGASESAIVQIHQYLDVWYQFVAFLVIPYLGNSAIRATGDTKWPSILMMSGGLVNVIFDPILIFGWGPIPALGIRGAAYATAIAWVTTFIGALWLLIYREHLIKLSRQNLTFFKQDSLKLFKLGFPICIANMAVPVGAAFLTALIAREGEAAVAAFGAGAQIETLAMVVAFALTSALSPYMAQNFGAGNDKRARAALRLTLKFGFIFQLSLYVLLMLGASSISGIFSDEPEVKKIITLYLWMVPLGGAFYTVFIILNTAFNASDNSSLTLLTTMIRLFVLLIPLAWLGQKLIGVLGLFGGIVCAQFLATIISWYIFKRNLHPDGARYKPPVSVN